MFEPFAFLKILNQKSNFKAALKFKFTSSKFLILYLFTYNCVVLMLYSVAFVTDIIKKIYIIVSTARTISPTVKQWHSEKMFIDSFAARQWVFSFISYLELFTNQVNCLQK